MTSVTHCLLGKKGNLVALQGLDAAVGELEAGADHELAHRAGDEDFAGAGEGADPGADVDRHAADVVADQLDLAGVDAGRTSVGTSIAGSTPRMSISR
jgi:hypothetical protein